MGTMITGAAVILICSNCTMAKIVCTTGVVLSIAKVKAGRDLAVGSGIIYVVVNIVKSCI